MSSAVLHSVPVITPSSRLRHFNLSPPFGLSSLHQATHFPRRTDQNREGPVVRVRCSSSRVSREYGGPTEEEAAAAAASFFGGYDLTEEDGDSEEDDDDDDDQESSLDLLIRFLQSMFGKVARRAKRASRSILPPAIPPQLVGLLPYSKYPFFKPLLPRTLVRREGLCKWLSCKV